MDVMSDAAQQMLEAFISVNGSDDANRLLIARRDVEDRSRCLHHRRQHLVQWRVPVRGINTDVKPLEDFLAPGSPPKVAFDATFLGHFGFTQDDPAAANITTLPRWTTSSPRCLSRLYRSGWTTDWSNASDTKCHQPDPEE
jgi:flagellar hook-associated protein 3 FlgL